MTALRFDPGRAREILALGAPIMIAMLTQTFINVIDTVFVGKLDPSVSIPGQAALGFSLPILWSIGGFLAAIGVGTQAMTARRLGAKKLAKAGQIMTNSLVVATLTSIAFTVVGWVWIPHFFEFLTPNLSVLELGVPYAQIRILGVLSLVATTAYKGFFDGLEHTRVHMWAAIVMNACNIVLNYILIFGLGPIPALEVTGAAIASLISTYIGLAVMLLWSLRSEYRERFQIYRLSNLQPGTMWELIKLSAPSGAAQVFVMSGVLLFSKIIGMLDEQTVQESLLSNALYANSSTGLALQDALRQLPALTGVSNLSDWNYTLLYSRPPIFTTAAKLIIDLLSIGFVTAIAFGTATATLVSRSMGEGKFDLAEQYGWDSVKIGMYFYGSLGLLVILFPAFFLDLLSDDPMVIAAASDGLRIMASLEAFIAMALILTQALFGAGDTKFVMYVELVLHGLCLAPLAYLFGVVLDLGFLGVWVSASLYVTALATVMALKFWHGSWKEIKV